MQVEVVVLNYSSQSLGEVSIQGEFTGGYYEAYGPGGTGGSTYCCIEVQPGPAEVEWEVGRPPGTPEPPEGWFRKAAGVIPKPNTGDRFLGVHIYDNETVEFTLSPDIPREKPKGARHEGQ